MITLKVCVANSGSIMHAGQDGYAVETAKLCTSSAWIDLHRLSWKMRRRTTLLTSAVGLMKKLKRFAVQAWTVTHENIGLRRQCGNEALRIGL